MTHYKATRPDGTDHRTRSLVHEAGAAVTHPTTRRYGDMTPNDPGTYLSVSVEPAETLIGGSWPCRLWEVQPVGRTVKRTDGEYPHKRGCRGYTVVRELPAYMALGPNGERVAALIERAGRLTPDEANRLSAVRSAAGYAAGYAAWSAAWSAAGYAAWSAAWSAAGYAAGYAAWSAAWDAARDAAGYAAGYAALALVVEGLITADEFDALHGPWRTAIEQETT